MLLLRGGQVWTGLGAAPQTQTLVIDQSRIVALGRDKELVSKYACAEEIDLGGRLVIPGLWDAHIHFYYWALNRQRVDLRESHSLEDMLCRIEQHCQDPERAWVTGWGWNENTWEQTQEPDRYMLDRITGPHKAAYFFRSDMHTMVANTRALELAGLMTDGVQVEGGIIERDSRGPTGILRELAVNRVTPLQETPSRDEVHGLFREAQAELHKFGITGICEQRMKDQDEGPEALRAFSRLDDSGHLKMRVSCNVAAHNLDALERLGLTTGWGNERLRLGHLKIFSDGTIGSRTAYMSQSFSDTESTGILITPREQMAQEIARATDLGIPVSIHSIGDRANELCLDLIEQHANKSVSQPHRIEHAQVLGDKELERFEQLNVTASVQPVHLLDDMTMAESALGERSCLAYRFAGLLKAGARLAFGSDAPVASVDPFLGLQAAVCRQWPDRMESGPWYPAECLKLQDALRAYTLGPAQASGWQELCGTIEVGKKADLCVLDRDLFALEEGGFVGGKLSDAKVMMTIFDGEIVYSAL